METKDLMIQNLRLRDLNPVSCGEEYCKPGHAFGPALREHWLLHYVVSGCGSFERDGTRYHLTAGQIFVIPPYEMTYYEADRRNPWHYRWVGFQSGLEQPLLRENAVLDAMGCGYIFRAMLECFHMEAGQEYFLCGKLWELLAVLSRPAASPEDRAAEYVHKAMNYIESNYVNPITVASIAQYLSLDRSYFSTLFKKHAGKPPQQYLVDFRLNKAAELLSIGLCTPSEAARSAGYTDLFNFSRMFKRKFGVSPSAYSNACKSTQADAPAAKPADTAGEQEKPEVEKGCIV